MKAIQMKEKCDKCININCEFGAGIDKKKNMIVLRMKYPDIVCAGHKRPRSSKFSFSECISKINKAIAA